MTGSTIKSSHKCIIRGCTNHKDEGNFVGDICSPCYQMITSGDSSKNSANFIHRLYEDVVMLKEKNKPMGQSNLLEAICKAWENKELSADACMIQIAAELLHGGMFKNPSKEDREWAGREDKPMEQSETTITVPVTLPKPPSGYGEVEFRVPTEDDMAFTGYNRGYVWKLLSDEMLRSPDVKRFCARPIKWVPKQSETVWYIKTNHYNSTVDNIPYHSGMGLVPYFRTKEEAEAACEKMRKLFEEMKK
jgi:hypothetical protein